MSDVVSHLIKYEILILYTFWSYHLSALRCDSLLDFQQKIFLKLAFSGLLLIYFWSFKTPIQFLLKINVNDDPALRFELTTSWT